jgi:hypothetical protein
MKRLFKWLGIGKRVEREFHAALEPTGRGANFTLYREPDGAHSWDWSLDLDIDASDPRVDRRVRQEASYAIAAMEKRLRLAPTFPANHPARRPPKAMTSLPGWPWQTKAKPSPPRTDY